MTDDLFDLKATSARRRRALARGPETFLLERAFEDILERLSFTNRRFGSALLIGGVEGTWDDRLRSFADKIDRIQAKDLDQLEPAAFDLAIALGGLDMVNDLPRALLTIRFALRPNGFFIGAISGGETLPKLRSAMRAADETVGSASPRVHPRIDPPALAGLLTSAGFDLPVVDVDRVRVSYKSLRDLVRDLRSMGVTNSLSARSRAPLTREAITAAERNFMANAEDGRTVETFEILHFAGWAPQ
jgi:NADH dehydrogenase [ubiquinone] 1 alpha subcomplex assembly factor 5